MEIAEEREGIRRGPFLAHEKKRWTGGEQHHRDGGFHGPILGRRVDPFAECAVADLIVVLNEIDEGERRQIARRLAAGNAAPVFGRLTLLGEPLPPGPAAMARGSAPAAP